MDVRPGPRFTAFAGPRRLAGGSLDDVAAAASRAAGPGAQILVFDDRTGRVVDVDLRGSEDEVRGRARVLAEALAAPGSAAHPPPADPRGRGRPRLGVVAREVTLLPRHWAWLGARPGGASAALRRLVDEARKRGGRREDVRRSQDAAYWFMSAVGGDLPGYEEALRALFAGDAQRFETELQAWPLDLSGHARRLAAAALGEAPAGASPASGVPATPTKVAILLFDEVEVLDFAGPFEIFSVAGRRGPGEPPFEVYTVAEKAGPVRARNGLVVTPHHTFDSCPEPDLIVIPGGYGSRAAMRDPAIVAWVKRQHERSRLTLSVCTGALVLATAGLLDGLRSTTHHGSYDLLAELAPGTDVVRGVRWVDNGKVITSAGVQAGMDMALHVVARLLGEPAALETARYIEYDWQPGAAG